MSLLMTTAACSKTNPFAIKFQGPKGKESYILAHQPKSFDWRARSAEAHPWKQALLEVYAAVCEQLNRIIAVAE